jgi:hypothetical protein
MVHDFAEATFIPVASLFFKVHREMIIVINPA